VFGLPFSFGKPLVFNAASGSRADDCCSYDASPSRQACSSAITHQHFNNKSAVETSKAKSSAAGLRLRGVTRQRRSSSSSCDQAGEARCSQTWHKVRLLLHDFDMRACKDDGPVGLAFVVSEQCGGVRSSLQETARTCCSNSCRGSGSQQAPMPAATAVQQLALLMLASCWVCHQQHLSTT
jgi:hypothetical protein